MGLLLLLAGVLAVAGGLGAFAYGVVYPDVQTIDRTAATVAATGGLVLIGLGALVSPLRRIAAALEAQNAHIAANARREAYPAREPYPDDLPAAPAPPQAGEAPQTSAAHAIGAAAIAAALGDRGDVSPAREVVSKAPEPRIAAAPEPAPPEPARAAPEVSINGAPGARGANAPSGAARHGSLADVVPEPVTVPQPDRAEVPPAAPAAPVPEPGARAPARAEAAGPSAPTARIEPKLMLAANRIASESGAETKPLAANKVEAKPAPAADKAPDKTADMAADKAPDKAEAKPVFDDKEQAGEAAAEDRSSEAPRPAFTLQVLKSGVIEGMAYTLYADGSVDAEVGGETRHFASIAEWRSHLRDIA